MTETVKISNSEAIRLELLHSETMSPSQYFRETDGNVSGKVYQEILDMTKEEFDVFLEKAIQS